MKYPAGYVTVAQTRWQYHERALERCKRLLPFTSNLNIAALGLKTEQRVNLNNAITAASAEGAWETITYVHAFLKHVAKWTVFFQNQRTPVLSMVERCIKDITKAADDIANAADAANDATAEEAMSLFKSEIESVFNGFASSDVYKLATVLDPRNAGFIKPAEIESRLFHAKAWLLPLRATDIEVRVGV